MVNRRGFLGAIAAGMVADPERLLWRPRRKLISIPRPRALEPWQLSLADLIEQEPGIFVSGYLGREHRVGDVVRAYRRPHFEVIGGELRSIMPAPLYYVLTPAGWRRDNWVNIPIKSE